ncbi:Hypothetical Protein FCC1311_050442 [Hondaea fermentalgiana]|uniref:Domain of unknown function at the cortex 1 domain-containing protein n=1 Tax=Hondaea fermentalgiana TaxID=2315210 RepID=A0A2R5GJI6_9STRA|nr:Hypothetical Protein FCC1311_050442 [Hondaea fermentalgiana]|eukprot:GBG28823.1 Hypothetical Protein FCC1311_050442 [Hondaea fermentalgiana]
MKLAARRGAHDAEVQDEKDQLELDKEDVTGEETQEEPEGYFSWLTNVTSAWDDEMPMVEVADTYDEALTVVKTPKGTAHFSCPRTLPHPDYWPDKPLLLRESMIHHGWDAETNVGKPLPTNGVSFPFETDLFAGSAMFRMRGLSTASDYFEGRARLSSIVVTGTFKQEVSFQDAMTGQEFCKPVKSPSSLLVKPLLSFFRLLAPLLQIHVGNQTYMLSPLAQTAQAIHVSDSPLDLQPDLDVEENFGEVEMDTPMDRAQRKKFFAKRSNLSDFSFRTDKCYTFDFYNDKLDMETFQLRALGQNFEIQPYLRDGGPRQRKFNLDEVIEGAFELIVGEYGTKANLEIPIGFYEMYNGALMRNFLASAIFYFYAYIRVLQLAHTHRDVAAGRAEGALRRKDSINFAAHPDLLEARRDQKARLERLARAYARVLLSCSNYEHTHEDPAKYRKQLTK